MDASDVLSRLRPHEVELRRMGIARLSLFGSTARGEAGPGSDVDLVARFEDNLASRLTLLDLAAISCKLEDLLESEVDFIKEPVRKQMLQKEIDRDRVVVF